MFRKECLPEKTFESFSNKKCHTLPLTKTYHMKYKKNIRGGGGDQGHPLQWSSPKKYTGNMFLERNAGREGMASAVS